MTLEPGNKDHPTIKQVFNWLMDKECTELEWRYLIGPLQKHVSDIMDYFLYDGRYGFKYHSHIAFGLHIGELVAEAIAIKCPVLKGSFLT